ncbi:helix-turn-helix domain-containing protein [Leifsonia shinshuensis]|uniref:Helix-turn-helix domain-containing protein n=1 Tax=Leifsonia shinshuensis TaxID=150026 RepID=A0A853CWT4_9MICO|nr:helix-turn-helix domain-containing protein [Leifsonia shinshuensis]NYJ23831.1 hypothetical protein [Leifsonia shinshuensis]
MSDLRPRPRPLAYSIPDAAAACGYSEASIQRAIAKGDLAPRYANSKGVILADELDEWLHSLPTEPPEKGRPR